MKARVIRGVLIRGKAHAEGAIGSVREDRQPQPGDAFAISHQEFHEMRTSNYVVKHEEPEATPAAAPAPAPAEPEPKKSGK